MAKAKAKTFKLHYYLHNGGDGAGSAVFCPSAKAAREADENQCERFSEDTASSVLLKYEDGKLFVEIRDDDTFKKTWVELK